MECRILTSKNSVKLKQYYYFHAEFLEVLYFQLTPDDDCCIVVDHSSYIGKATDIRASIFTGHIEYHQATIW